MSCLEFLGCLLQFMEYLSREKNTGGCLRQRWGVCVCTQPFFLSFDMCPYTHRCSGIHTGWWIDLRCLSFVSAQKLLSWFPLDGNTLWADHALIHVSSRLPYQLEHLCWAAGQPLPWVTGLAEQWGWRAQAACAYQQTCPLGRDSACDERADPSLTTLFLETLSMAFLSLSLKGIPLFAYVMM